MYETPGDVDTFDCGVKVGRKHVIVAFLIMTLMSNKDDMDMVSILHHSVE